MKKIIFLIILFAAGASLKVFSQTLKVTSFKQTNDLTASRIEKRDINGIPCGLIKVWLPITDAKFVGNVVETTYKNGEWWVYMTNGSKKITIKSSKHPPLSYEFTEPIQSKVTYTMAIEILKEVDPLYVDGWSIYKNGRRLGDNEIRTLFANTPAYEQYEKGFGICKSTFWHEKDRWGLPTINGIAYTLLAGGGVMVIMGYGFAPLEESDGDVDGAVLSRKFGAAGLVVTGVSCGLFLIKAGVLASGKAKIRKAVNLYNNQGMYSQSDVKMEYGLTGNGVYFSLLF